MSAPFRMGGVEVRAWNDGRRLIVNCYGLAEARALVDCMIGKGRLRWITKQDASVGKMVIQSDRLVEVMKYDGRVPELVEPYATLVGMLKGEARAVETRVRPMTARIARAEGATTISELAERVGLSGREARGVLRRAKVARPYAWIETEAIEAMLRKYRARRK